MENRKIGEKIKKEREKLGFTLKELASKIGYENYQTLSNIEKGKKHITMGDLYKISKALGLQIDYFLYNKKKKEPLFVWREIKDKKRGKLYEQKLLQYIDNYSLILKLNDMKYPIFTPPLFVKDIFDEMKSEFDFASQLAIKIRMDYLRLGEYPGQELLQSLLDKGIIIFKMDFQGVGSAISMIHNKRAGILINNEDVPWRITFDIAHELFHLLTWEIYSYNNLSEERYLNIEKIANAFAINLLVPKTKVKEKIKLYNKINEMCIIDEAIEFKVSIDAFCNRLKFLKIINEKEEEKFKKDPILKKMYKELFYLKYGKEDEYFVEDLEVSMNYFIKAFNIYKLGKISKMKFAELINKNIAEIDWLLSKRLNYQ